MAYPTFQELLPILTNAAKRWVPDFAVDAENETAVRLLLAWSSAHPRFEGDPGKGVLLMGHKGSGKTLLMRSLGACIDPSLRFAVHNTRKVTSAYNIDGDVGLRPYLAAQHMLFDDLGDERGGQHYGDKVEVMSLVIQDRYELFIDQGIMSHFTTNLTGPELRERYGERVYSRLKHMVNSTRVGAEKNAVDRRETAKAPARVEAKAPEFIPASQEVAQAGFARVREAIADAKKQLDVKALNVRPEPSEEEKRIEFASKVMQMNEDQLERLSAEVVKGFGPELSKPYLDIIEKEKEERAQSTAA